VRWAGAKVEPVLALASRLKRTLDLTGSVTGR